MGILSEKTDLPELGKLNKKYTYIRGTGAYIKNQRIDQLKKRYLPTPAILELMDVKAILYPRTISDMINFAFNSMSETDILPAQIIPYLHKHGIMCDVVNMIIQRERATDNIIEIQFDLYVKKSGRERYVRIGHASLVIVKNSARMTTMNKRYWKFIIKAWKESEPVRLTSIFRRKKRIAKLVNESHTFLGTYESYVCTR